MNQVNWIYLDDYSKRHAVGMLHGEETGHLLIHVNSNIIVIDFHVLEDKKYSFFIQGELCEVSINKEEEQFSYSFVINDQIRTPRNIELKRMDRRDLYISLFVMGGFFTAIIIAVLILLQNN